MKNNQKGFTLIELMIVVAIIAILAAIAIPQYQSYILKTQMTRAVAELGGLRTAIEVCQNDGTTGAACSTDTIESDMLLPHPQILFSPDGKTVTVSGVFGTNAHEKLTGGTVVLTRSPEGKWTCDMTVPGIELSLVPRECR